MLTSVALKMVTKFEVIFEICKFFSTFNKTLTLVTFKLIFFVICFFKSIIMPKFV